MKIIKSSTIVITALLLGIILTGCGKKVEVLEPTGYANQYRISVVGDSGYVPLQSVYLKAEKEARAKCKQLGKNYHFVNKSLIPTAFAVFPQADIIFECNSNLIATEQKVIMLNKDNIAEKLKTIEKLYKEKLITKEEYLNKRNDVLNEF